MMKYKKATKIVAAVVLGTQILALLLTFILMMNERMIYEIMGFRAEASETIFIVPWASIFTIMVHVCFAVLLMVMVNMTKGKAMLVFSIVLAGVIFINSAVSPIQMIMQSAVNASKGAYYIAASNTITQAISLVTGPLMQLGTFAGLFVCGMCVCIKDR